MRKKKIKEVRVFIDMDGVLAEWTPVEVYEQLFEKGRFDKLPVQNWVVTGLKESEKMLNSTFIKTKEGFVKLQVEYHIMTSCVDSPYAIPEKSEWLDKEFDIPKHKRIYVVNGHNKANYVPGGITGEDILIDDYSFNLHRWKNSGGKGIKLMNGVNGSNGTWIDNYIPNHSTPNDFYKIILKTITEKH